jgi:hypothetical protein
MRSLSLSFVVAALLVAAGCSSSDGSPASAAGDSAAPVAPASGARLHARLVTGGGAREVVGFHDTKRDEDCTFQPAEDGRMRCLPASVPLPGSSTFADAACTVPLVRLPTPQPSTSCDAAPKYVMSYDSAGGCTNNPKELRKLVPHSGPSFSNQSGGCAAQPAPSPSSAPLFALGDTVSFLELVEAKVTPVAALPASETVLLGIDGSRQHYGFHDDAHDVDCTYELMADGVMRCLPKGQRGAMIFSDGECATPSAVRFYSGGCGASDERFWLDAADAARCRGVRAVYPVGTAYDGDTSSLYTQYVTYSGSGTTATTQCSSIGFGGGNSDLRAIKADLTPSLPTMPRVGTGGGRLVPALVADASKTSLVSGWHDTERDVDCAFTRASDGKLRCLPNATAAKLFSTDAKCTSPGKVVVLTEVACTGSSGFAVVASTTCPSTTRVFSLAGAPHDVPNASTESVPGRCVAFPSVQGAYDATEVDPTQFVEGIEGPE